MCGLNEACIHMSACFLYTIRVPDCLCIPQVAMWLQSRPLAVFIVCPVVFECLYARNFLTRCTIHCNTMLLPE